MRKINSEKQRARGIAVEAPFTVVRHLYLGETAKRFPPPLKIRDLVMGKVCDMGLENRCNAYILSEVVKDNVYYRDSRRDVLGIAGDNCSQTRNKISDNKEAYVFTPHEVRETYAVQLYTIED